MAGLGLVALLAGVGLLVRGSGTQEHQDEAAQAAGPAGSKHDAAHKGGGAAPAGQAGAGVRVKS
jgi:hypothetical protein